MILLDTDHLSVFMDARDPRHGLLNSRMEAVEKHVACTIVNVEEMLRGWLANLPVSPSLGRSGPGANRCRSIRGDSDS